MNKPFYKQKKTHLLKLREEYAEAVAKGLKTFEIRYNDRDYKVGDIVKFIVIDNNGEQIFENALTAKSYKISYILSDFVGLTDGYIAFAIKQI